MRWTAILIIMLAGCGGSGEADGGIQDALNGHDGLDEADTVQDTTTPECIVQTDCGKPEEVVCIDGICGDQAEGFGELLMGVGFPRGSTGCADQLLARVYLEPCEESPVNLLTFEHTFHLNWSGGGTYFYNLPLVDIRPGSVSVVVDALDEGVLVGSGCTIAEVVPDARLDVVVSITLF